MLGAAQTLTFHSIRSQEPHPLSTEADGDAPVAPSSAGPARVSSRTAWTCGGVAALAVVLSLFAIPAVFVRPPNVAPPPTPPPPPLPPVHPPSPPPPSPRAPHVDVVSDGSPYAYSDVSGTKVIWAAAQANAAGWPTGQPELLYLDWAPTSDGATPAGLGYRMQLHSGGSYATTTTAAMESTCRGHCSNQGQWLNSTGGAIADRCQFFVMVDQSAMTGVHKISCVWFRGGGPFLQEVAGSGLPAGTDGYVYSLVPFVV